MSAQATFDGGRIDRNAVFTTFLQRRLHEEFDNALVAPVPEGLLKALDERVELPTSGEGLPAAQGLAFGVLASIPLWAVLAAGIKVLVR